MEDLSKENLRLKDELKSANDKIQDSTYGFEAVEACLKKIERLERELEKKNECIAACGEILVDLQKLTSNFCSKNDPDKLLKVAKAYQTIDKESKTMAFVLFMTIIVILVLLTLFTLILTSGQMIIRINSETEIEPETGFDPEPWFLVNLNSSASV